MNTDDVLVRLAALPVSEWTYGFDHRSVRHLGPMAQDFAAAFALGHSERRISGVDANGVCMASIQALYRRILALEAAVGEAECGDRSRSGTLDEGRGPG